MRSFKEFGRGLTTGSRVDVPAFGGAAPLT